MSVICNMCINRNYCYEEDFDEEGLCTHFRRDKSQPNVFATPNGCQDKKEKEK